jgi:hypothetical protein
MANALFGWPAFNWALTAPDLQAGSIAGELGPQQLQTDQGSPSTAWQTSAGVLTPEAGAWVEFRLPAAQSWRVFSLHRTNLTASAQIRWRVADAEVGSPAYDSGLIAAGVSAGFGQSVTVLPAGVSGSLCRLDISDPDNPDGFINIPLLYAGDAWEPARNIAWDSTPSYQVEAEEVTTRGGQEFPVFLYARRSWDISHQSLGADEVMPLMEMLRSTRRGGNCLFVPDPASAERHREAVFGRLKSEGAVSFPFQSLERRSWRGQVTERL